MIIKVTILSPETIIEVIAIKGNTYHKKEMTYAKALEMKRKPGFQYRFYQQGFSQFKTN